MRDECPYCHNREPMHRGRGRYKCVTCGRFWSEATVIVGAVAPSGPGLAEMLIELGMARWLVPDYSRRGTCARCGEPVIGQSYDANGAGVMHHKCREHTWPGRDAREPMSLEEMIDAALAGM